MKALSLRKFEELRESALRDAGSKDENDADCQNQRDLYANLVKFPEADLAALVDRPKFLSEFENTRYSSLNGRMAGYARQACSTFPSDSNA